MLWDYKNITNYLHFGENPFRFGSVVMKKYGFLNIFFMFVKGAFRPSFVLMST